MDVIQKKQEFYGKKALFVKAAQYTLICLGIPALTLALLLAATFVPRELIQENALESAAWLKEKNKVWGLVNERDATSVADYSFDAIWLDIAYCLDMDPSLKAAVNAAYYENEDLFTSFYELVSAAEGEKPQPDVSYARYWQGMAGILRLLLPFWNLQELYAVNLVVCFLLLAAVIFLLCKRREYCFLAALAVGLWSAGAYTVPFCVFYMPVFVITFGMLIRILLKKDGRLFPYFLAAGLLAACFDNLSAETLTVSLPLLLALILAYRRGEITQAGQALRYACSAGALWTAGYAFAFVSKWALSVWLLGPESLNAVADHAARRLYGSVGAIPVQIARSFLLNFARLKPFALTETYGGLLVAALAVGLPVFYLAYLYGKRTSSCVPGVFLLLPALIPLLRFVVLNSHSYGHVYMVYRALLVSVTAVVFFFLESLSFEEIKAAHRRKPGKKRR